MQISRADVADLIYFMAIARHRSFSRAAIELGVSASALSHALKGLETRLGVRLLNRTTKSVTPTAAGEELVQSVLQPFDTIEGALESLNRYRNTPTGRIRINAAVEAANLLLAPVMPAFMDRYPDIEIDIVASNRMVDVTDAGFDAGIRYGGTVPEDMVARRLSADIRWVIAASPDYLERYGTPEHPDDLFAAGAVAAGYGMGAIITTFPISLSLTTNGLEHTMTTFGILFALVGFLASQGLKLPPPAVSQPVSQTVVQSSRSFTSREMLRQPLFWLMFAMMAMMSTSGLMVTSQMAVFAEDFGISQAVVFGMAALPLALTIDRFTNGLTRPLFGFISDRFGREQTMFIAFALEGVAMMLWLACREDPLLFVLLSGVVFFGWGEIFSLFPSTLTDTFGSEHAASNYGWLYISQGIGSIFGGPLAALLYQHTHGWHVVFSCAIGLDFVTAALALWVLKPWRARFIRQHS